MPKKLFDEVIDIKQHSISDFLLDEEASIPKGRLLVIGSLMVVLAIVLGIQDAFAGHRSHRSHSSHRSGAYHRSHVSHTSHTSGNHHSHSSHSSSYTKAVPSVSPKAYQPAPVDPSTLKLPQALPDTIPLK